MKWMCWSVLLLMVKVSHCEKLIAIDAGPPSYYPDEQEPIPGLSSPSMDNIGSVVYPVNIGISSPPEDIYEENTTYFEDDDCHSVKNCPWEYHSSQDYIFPPSNMFPVMPYLPRQTDGIGLSCNVEADCFAQEEIPRNLSRETDVLFLRSPTFRTLEIGNLSVLPPLVKLRISYSDLQLIYPGAFSSQSTLETLELVGNDIENILPSTFAELINLESLDLSSNSLLRVNSEMFTGLSKVKDLILQSNLLRDIPNYAFKKLPELRELTLDDNNITNIAKYAFSGVPNLKYLYLNYNQLTAVPSPALQQIPSLLTLQLKGNFLRRIYKNDFKGMDKLRTLWLDECGLVKIAKKAFQNKNIKTLVLSDNELNSLPNLRSLSRLQTLRLDNNPLFCYCNLWWAIRWIKRKNIDTPSVGPECASPAGLVGLRALELTQEQLCQRFSGSDFTRAEVTKNVDRVQPMSPDNSKEDYATGSGSDRIWNTKSYDYENTPDTTNDHYGGSWPKGGWSSHPYDTDKLYKTTFPELATPETQDIPTTERITVQTASDVTSTIIWETTMLSSFITTDKNTEKSTPLSVAATIENTENITPTKDEKLTTSRPLTSGHQESVTTTKLVETDLIQISTKQDEILIEEGDKYPWIYAVACLVLLLLLVAAAFLIKYKICKPEQSKCNGKKNGEELHLQPSPVASKLAEKEKQTPTNPSSEDTNGAVTKTQDNGEVAVQKKEQS